MMHTVNLWLWPFCETDCISNCEGEAEFGEYAENPLAFCTFEREVFSSFVTSFVDIDIAWFVARNAALVALGTTFAGMAVKATTAEALPYPPSCFMSVGGWSLSDPGSSHTYWSDMAFTHHSRKTFANALLTMQKYGFDGVDLDCYWFLPTLQRSGMLEVGVGWVINEQAAEPIWDEEAAFNYLVWEEYPWVSFGNTKTFQQKINYANEVF
ncbi:hypothetical protein CNMCM8927_003605 [Aspergillus lentulus]|uniref:Uncharacterized protein n=1 Tax=Aspergillus lentulus TaxID=293939 RepID=A0AAN5YFB5_ASPLE|nr:hypothetical protein CNMCM8060_003454 [Aspergillus lentulus]KAF4185105.1 hypothetical protein CNMCM7927_007130 [Aspergillus lentulus]KAF4191587.1 hypothetical protein CNMCM8694_001690 [Aspergillus lentulus]KAF4200297.1 hypothetical protein CNMCM8927_003605 [Aspergillus lentulus]GFF96246.1 hypothetical protein IFM47457_10778 [Aspergillus lentulus]